jgi:hypothetical protein
MDTDLTRALVQWIVLSIVVWVVSTTMARARILRSFRCWMKKRNDFLGEGVSCQYCLSHWVGLAVTLLYRPALIGPASIHPHWNWLAAIADYLVSAFAVIGLAALIARNLGKTPPDGIHPDIKEWTRVREEVIAIAPEVQPLIELAEQKTRE